jgi:Tol biopolymer transport system component
MDSTGSNQHNLTNTFVDEYVAAWSPDGLKIIFGKRMPSGNIEIFMIDTTGSNLQQLTHNNNHNHEPTWSPDGTQIAFVAYGTNSFEIFVMDSSGSNQQNITNHSANDWNPTWHPSNSVEIYDQEEESNPPKTFKLFQNYPNPFNPSTTITYQVPENSFVSIKVYDLLGKEVTSLVNEEKAAGIYDLRFDAGKLSSGFYLYTMKAGNFVETKKMLLMK